jgi:hypothetical protein
VDTLNDFSSYEFSDELLGGSTYGKVTESGNQAFTIKDAFLASEGVAVRSISGTLEKPAKIDSCSGSSGHMILHVLPGDHFSITCHNWILEGIEGNLIDPRELGYFIYLPIVILLLVS